MNYQEFMMKVEECISMEDPDFELTALGLSASTYTMLRQHFTGIINTPHEKVG